MRMNKTYILAALLSLLCLTGCELNKMKPYDQPFLTFTYNNSYSTSVDAEGTFDAQYFIHLSSRRLEEPLVVTVAAIPGDGLKEGVDYELISKGGKVTFYPGIYDIPVRIRWKKNIIDTSKDNSLTLRLESTSMDEVMLGVPGPAEKDRTLTIRKYIIR